jgi:hypothetical protein
MTSRNRPLVGAGPGAVEVAMLLAAVAGVGCAAHPPPLTKSLREVVLAYDDAHASGTMAFPNPTYESVVRFEIPQGEHQPLRLRFQAEAPGQVEITIYDSSVLETPGSPLCVRTRDIGKEDVSDGKDGRWVIENLDELKPFKGVVWVGVHKTGGEPTLWASPVVSGQVFIRNNDPGNPMGLLPTKRTPMLRLELAP